MNNFNELTKELIKSNKGSFVSDLICEPTKEQMDSLIEGSGNPKEEMLQVNSSAGLAVNYWRAFELSHKSRATVEFEWKKRKPLSRGLPANIDVVVREGTNIVFVESKFLEPYYSENEIPREAYFDVNKYSPCMRDSAGSWVELFKQASDFKYYNVTQLCRHLLAITKDIWKSPKEYQNKNVRLISVTWDMPYAFLKRFPPELADIFEKRRQVIREEAHKSERFLNDFINEHLFLLNLKYQAVKYNDIIAEITEPIILARLKEKYYL